MISQRPLFPIRKGGSPCVNWNDQCSGWSTGRDIEYLDTMDIMGVKACNLTCKMGEPSMHFKQSTARLQATTMQPLPNL